MEKINLQLKKLINKEVERKFKEERNDFKDYIKAIEGFADSLDNLEDTGRECLKQSTEEKLKFSEAEAEGFLRAIITVKNYFKDDMCRLNSIQI